MTCERVRAQLTSYLDGELDGDAGTVVRGHLRTCEACRAIAADEAVHLVRLAVNAVALSLLETRVLYAEPSTDPALRAYADWAVGFLQQALLARRPR